MSSIAIKPADLHPLKGVVCSFDESDVVFVEAERTTHEAVKAEYVAHRLQQCRCLSALIKTTTPPSQFHTQHSAIFRKSIWLTKTNSNNIKKKYFNYMKGNGVGNPLLCFSLNAALFSQYPKYIWTAAWSCTKLCPTIQNIVNYYSKIRNMVVVESPAEVTERCIRPDIKICSMWYGYECESEVIRIRDGKSFHHGREFGVVCLGTVSQVER